VERQAVLDWCDQTGSIDMESMLPSLWLDSSAVATAIERHMVVVVVVVVVWRLLLLVLRLVVLVARVAYSRCCWRWSRDGFDLSVAVSTIFCV
jgi:hypothetical protein